MNPTPRILSLAQLIALPCDPAAMMRLAAQVGVRHVGLRLLPAAPGGLHHPVHTQPQRLREALAVQADTGVQVLDLEIIRLDAHFNPADHQAFMATGAQLGARHILVAGDDPDRARTIDHFGQLCRAAQAHGLSCELEFMPWTAVKTVADARQVVEQAAEPNGGILVDALHWARCGSTLDEVAAIPPERLRYAQICDGRVPGPATEAEMVFDARCERLLPGEGGIPLADLFSRLPADIAVSVEVPSERRSAVMGFEAWARAAVDAARGVLGSAG